MPIPMRQQHLQRAVERAAFLSLTQVHHQTKLPRLSQHPSSYCQACLQISNANAVFNKYGTYQKSRPTSDAAPLSGGATLPTFKLAALHGTAAPHTLSDQLHLPHVPGSQQPQQQTEFLGTQQAVDPCAASNLLLPGSSKRQNINSSLEHRLAD